ncbi:MAG: bifunctional heptose 7-phosphate kinase/heptose 1-phosphate adenyltransferase [Phycisphaerae bacterium]|nr:bifunctional heptose 7-phosphate kinase/heptose 1-phosphate adenyltransferase [Phycisphaerae bacterium]
MYEKLLKIVTNLGSPGILVVGDFMLDTYIYGDALRISPEAPVPILKIKDTKNSLGGAASVAKDLCVLGAKVFCIGVIGKDQNGLILKEQLADAGAETNGLLEVRDHPTINKQRLIGLAQHRHQQQLFRMDLECTDPLPENQKNQIIKNFEDLLDSVEVVCLQDYNKGLLDEKTCQAMIKAANKRGKKILIDPSPTSNYKKYSGASLITPNRQETSIAVGFEIEDTKKAAQAAAKLKKDLSLDAVVITLDKEGAYLLTNSFNGHIPTRPRTVYDVTGAGDMVLATLAITLAVKCDYRDAVELSNIAGGIEVEKFGVATVSIQEIVNEIVSLNRSKGGKIKDMEILTHDLEFHRHNGDKIVFTNGCFDVLHRGHIEYLKFCKSQGDIVVLGLNSDNSVRQIKGPTRPINNQFDRASVLAALESIDYIVIFDDPDPLSTVEKVKPDILVKGKDWAEKGVIGREFVESHGGKVVLTDLVEGKSSTATIEKMRSLEPKDEQ